MADLGERESLCECGHFATDHLMRTPDPGDRRGACFKALCRCKGFVTPSQRREAALRASDLGVVDGAAGEPTLLYLREENDIGYLYERAVEIERERDALAADREALLERLNTTSGLYAKWLAKAAELEDALREALDLARSTVVTPETLATIDRLAAVLAGGEAAACSCDHGLVWDPRVDGNVVPCPKCAGGEAGKEKRDDGSR